MILLKLEKNMTNKTIAFVLARKGSKRLPGKNIRELNGKPLIHYVLEAAIASRFCHEVIVSSDCDEILNAAKKIKNVSAWERPDYLSADESTSIEVIKYLLKEYENKYAEVKTVVLLQPTSPFTSTLMIDTAISEFIELKSKYLFTVVKSNIRAEWLGTVVNKFFHRISANSCKETQYRPSGNVYIYSRDYLMDEDSNKQITNPHILEISESEAVDIDTLLDFQFAEFLIQKKILNS
jgi:CMP-N,N'-diacetyllegionaminic acid synthase